MKTHHRFIVIIVGMLLLLMVANLLNVGYHFRTGSEQASLDKAKTVASLVQDALTTFMVNHQADQRNQFLDRIAHKEGIERLWIARSDNVVKQYGPGSARERPHDALDRETLRTGTIHQKTYTRNGNDYMRISLPYVADPDSKPDCLSCHRVAPGSVLGAVGIEMNISNMRAHERTILMKILLINLFFIVMGILITNYFFKPYVRFFESLKAGVREAYRGNFSFRFPKTLKGDGEELAEHLNELYGKMDETFGRIQSDLGTFLIHKHHHHDDPLHEAHAIIQELSDIYKFKRTIEFDMTREEIYRRLVKVLQEKFAIERFTLYEMDKHSKRQTLIYSTDETPLCTLNGNDLMACRAYRTDSVVDSHDFVGVCPLFEKADTLHYLCIPTSINAHMTLVLSCVTRTEESLRALREQIGSMEHYFETAKPVLESRILTDQLRDSSLRDGLTGLYNRRYLEQFIDTVIHTDNGSLPESYHLLMLDIDYFKPINDTYGHDAGDTVIRKLADIIREAIPVEGTAVRYGGEEFLILLPHVSEEDALRIAQWIQSQFNRTPFTFEGDTLTKTLSIGIAAHPEDNAAFWQAIKYADVALYEAKYRGRNRIVRFMPDMFQYRDEQVKT
jgi:diguanylate cyclase (GGDEF)-like protein